MTEKTFGVLGVNSSKSSTLRNNAGENQESNSETYGLYLCNSDHTPRKEDNLEQASATHYF